MTRKRSEEQLGAAAARLSAVLHKNRAAVRLLLATALLAWLLTSKLGVRAGRVGRHARSRCLLPLLAVRCRGSCCVGHTTCRPPA